MARGTKKLKATGLSEKSGNRQCTNNCPSFKKNWFEFQF